MALCTRPTDLSSNESNSTTINILALGRFPSFLRFGREQRGFIGLIGGGGGIRTHETLTGLTVFKTVAIDHSATPPGLSGLDILSC